ncbi:MAG: type II toxin-antitoxin system RelE/ParE family toxin [Nitrosospira sp.]
MSYELSFHPDALAEWKKLDAPVHEMFKKKLAERLQNPRIPSARLSGHKDRFKIKLRDAGYRLVYEVRDGVLMVVVVAVGKRERNAVYKAAAKRQQKEK